MDSAGNVAELLERECDLAPREIEPRLCLGVGGQALLEPAQVERQGDEPLLRAVVEIPLQPLPLLLAFIDHACSRAAELFETRLELRVQPCVLERNARRGG